MAKKPINIKNIKALVTNPSLKKSRKPDTMHIVVGIPA